MEKHLYTSSSHSKTEGGNTVLHNVAEDIVRLKVAKIMEDSHMCTCPDCINDVMALTLNNVPPLYTVTEKGKLFQKLNTCETQYGTDLAKEVTKACLVVAKNPNHNEGNKEQA